MHVLVTCKNEEDPIKIEGSRVATTFLPLKVYEDSSFRRSLAANSAAGGRIWPNFEIVRAFMHVLITCKYKKIG